MEQYNSHPCTSPWGEVQHCDEIAPGMFQVDTASHGGILVHESVVHQLSVPASNVGFREGQYHCFEEDCDAAVVFRELLDRPGWQVPDSYISTRERFEAAIDRSLDAYHKDYLSSRTVKPVSVKKPVSQQR